MKMGIDSFGDNCSLWTATAGRAPETGVLAGREEADVVVVGGGFTGLSAALHLAEMGYHVIVVEAHHLGWGASGRNSGQVIPGLKYDPDTIETLFERGKGKDLIQSVGASADHVFRLIQNYNIDCDARQTGWLQPAHSKRAFKGLVERAKQWMNRGVEAEIVNQIQTQDLIGSGDYVGGWIDYRGGTVHPLRYAYGLANAAQGKGARLYVDSPVRSVQSGGSDCQVITDHAQICCRKVILATNAYSFDIWPRLRKTIAPIYSTQAATPPLPAHLRRGILPSRLPVSDTRRVLQYFRFDEGNRLLIGSVGSFRDRPSTKDKASLEKALHALFPQLINVSFEYCWSGRIAVTRDHLPHIHRLSPNVVTGLGYNGRGIALATLMGKMLSKLTVGEKSQELPFPVTDMPNIPLHFLYKPISQLLVYSYRTLDRLEQII